MVFRSGNPRATGWVETGNRQHDRRGHIHVIGQLFESLREKKSPTDKWTGCARPSREPAIRNVRAWPFMRNTFFDARDGFEKSLTTPDPQICRFETGNSGD